MRALILTCLIAIASWALAEVKVEPLEYDVAGVQHQGFIAYDDSMATKPPGVLVFPEWWGPVEYSKARARMLAKLGYAALVVDMYGEGKTTTDAQEAQTLAKSVLSKPEVMVQRAEAALQALKQSGKADNARVAAIGYCMGGTVALNLARTGADLKAVVGFHCGLANSVKEPKPLRAQVLVCNGADDKMISAEEQRAFESEMRDAKADWTYVVFGGAMHAFTNPEADKYKSLGTIGYNASADRRSWRMMRSFLADALEHRPDAAAERGIGTP